MWDGIIGVFTFAWENGIRPVTDALGMTDQILRGWDNLKAAFDRILDGIGAAFEAAWDRIKPVIDAMKWVNESWKGISGVGGGREGTTAPEGADVIAPPAPSGDMRDGLAGGTAGIRVQGITDAQAYGDGFREGMGIRSPSRVMAQLGTYMSQGLGMGITAGQPVVDAASAGIGQSMADQITPYFDNVLQGAESLGDVFDNVKASFADMLSDMASRLFSSGLSGILGSVFGAGDALAGALSGAGLNAIPAFARGTPFSPDGLARLNERGGEILDLPGGTRVIPHDISKRMADGAAAPASMKLEIVPSELFKVQMHEVSTDAAAQMGVQVSKSLPAQVQRTNIKPRRR